ncbi:MAG: hypothetical protein KJ721_00065, partial [Nanoarchaeota archaeon]|nr:hypothetical protein [Nanoarchaeota archaeon]
GIPSERICFEGILETAGHNLMNVQLQYEIYDEIESYLARSSAERKSIHEHDRRMNITQRLFPYRKYQIALTPEEKKKFNSSKSI